MTEIIIGDALATLQGMADQSVNCCVTSPPYYGLRDYKVDGQLGLESTPDEYVAKMVSVFREVRRVLRDDGTLWLNLGDSYSTPKTGNTETTKNPRAVTSSFKKRLPPGMQAKQLLGIPWRVAFALQADGWILRQDIIWSKPNPMPESVKDRCTKAHEYLFLLSKSERYFFDNEAMKEPVAAPPKPCGPKNDAMRNDSGRTGIVRGDGETRNRRSVWSVCPRPYKGAHFATFPPQLIEPCIKAGCPEGGIVLDPFGGSGTTGMVAQSLNRHATLIELNPAYRPLMESRLAS